VRVFSLALALALALLFTSTLAANDLRLWYRQPADHWHQALPLGNGRLGAMLYGSTTHEVVHLNESGVWSGEPYVRPDGVKDHLAKVRELLFAGRTAEAQAIADEHMTMKVDPRYGAYQPLGDLRIELDPSAGTPTDYERDLDLTTATAHVRYRIGDATWERSAFVSAPDNAIVYRFTCDKPARISLRATLERSGGGDVSIRDGKFVELAGQCSFNGSHFAATLTARAEGGRVEARDNSIIVSSASALDLIVTASSSLTANEPLATARSHADRVEQTSFAELLKRHVDDYQRYFDRASIDLGRTPAADLPTDARVARFKADVDADPDPGLAALYFQYGRYLLISCSRPGGMPANLQGLWNPLYAPPWYSDYTININFQMNYWLAEVANLGDLHEPLFGLFERLGEPARRVARERYGCGGVALSTRTTPWGNTDLRGSAGLLWQEGMAWLALHFWEHYEYSQDRQFLRTRAYPALKSATEFYVDFLVKDPSTGFLVAGPSTSPENSYLDADGKRCSIDMGPTMTMQIVRELFDRTIRANELLGEDASFRERLSALRAKLRPTQIGSDGRILEWSREYREVDPGHRHVSHLWGLFPSDQITVRGTPELAKAAVQTLDFRRKHGGGYVGWGRAWMLCLYARLEDANEAHSNWLALLKGSTLDNLFDAHWRANGTVFQIDGNFGAAAGLAEMLLASHSHEIHPLPALPDAWPSGSFRGLRTRGGHVVDAAWQNHRLVSAVLTAGNDGEIRLRTAVPVDVRDAAGGAVEVRRDGLLTRFEAQNGHKYLLNAHP
jgi:alpha-L-fucosidase 2